MAKRIQDSLNFRLTATLLRSWNLFLGRGRVWSRYLSEILPIQYSSFTWLKRIFSGFQFKSNQNPASHSNTSQWDIFGAKDFVALIKQTFSSCTLSNQGFGQRVICEPLIISRNFENTVTILNEPVLLRTTDTRPRVTVRISCVEEPPIIPFRVIRSIFLQERRMSVNELKN